MDEMPGGIKEQGPGCPGGVLYLGGGQQTSYGQRKTDALCMQRAAQEKQLEPQNKKAYVVEPRLLDPNLSYPKSASYFHKTLELQRGDRRSWSARWLGGRQEVTPGVPLHQDG